MSIKTQQEKIRFNKICVFCARIKKNLLHTEHSVKSHAKNLKCKGNDFKQSNAVLNNGHQTIVLPKFLKLILLN